jgi:hypothetical protein
VTFPQVQMAGSGAPFPIGSPYPVVTLARYVLDTIVATYEAHADVATPLPTSRRIAIGTVATDYENLTVMYGGTTIGLPGNDFIQPMRGDAPRVATFDVELWRTVQTSYPNGMPASDEMLDAAAAIVMQDSWVLLEAAAACDPRNQGVVASVGVVEPSGELQGVSMTLAIQVP